ncbi:MAG TPA: tRNA uridine-5-carboxymethylaminomethyl(34) synthesis GTPase MnmE [bacterium]|nr:tRNA uridine-5-carboxymethylaminomethyl(34) synthesis GTPase MnmE [bacterium]HPS30069.1 tRNA uridine-5-carboxymethylaminomethyl(34) synthesis GTPase MnmE [bacterium]
MYHARLKNTIAALATSPGSTIGIIRISGCLSFKIACELTGRKSFSHMKAVLAKLHSKNVTVIDRCIVLSFKAPNSYTGEDVVEFHVHGSSLNASDVLVHIFKLGAIPALKGEFTFRALLNSKISLSEAFSLNTLITSNNPFAVELARKESFENDSIALLRKFIKDWEFYLTAATALIDFPDQVSYALPYEKINSSIVELNMCLTKIISNTQSFQKLTDFSILVVGKPNVGKSSLFNLLLNKQRAITSDIPGTTRDYLCETLYIKGFPVTIIDSAGIHDSDYEIEKQGIIKSKQLIENSNLILLVIDSSHPLDINDKYLIEKTSKMPRLIIENKTDISSKNYFKDSVKASCLTQDGINQILNFIDSYLESVKPDSGELFFFNEWQIQTALKIISSLENLTINLESEQIELIHFCIKDIFYNVRNISGEISTFDVYDKIFNSFCLGK